MQYKSASCAIDGSCDTTGLSDLDQLAVHVLYPGDLRVAEFIGTTVDIYCRQHGRTTPSQSIDRPLGS
jgi:hypothetical protein